MRSRIRREDLLAVLAVTVFAALTFAVVWSGTTKRVGGDSYWYLRNTERYLGVSTAVADQRAATVVCDELNRSSRLSDRPATCRTYPAITDPRYVAIFDSRPGYPVMSAPLVEVLGLHRGMAASTALLFVEVSVLTFVALRLSGLSPPAAVLGGAAMAVLPPALWDARLLAEGASLVTVLITVIGALLVLRRRRVAGSALVGVGMIAGYATKPATAAAVGLALTAAGVLLLVIGRRGPSWRSALWLAGTGTVSLLGWVLVSRLLHLPSLDDTVQDMLTAHFHRPDVPHPLSVLAGRTRDLWLTGLPYRLGVPWPFVVVLPAVAYAVVRLRAAGWVWAVVALAPVAVVSAHPLTSEYPRLIAPSWIAVAVGLALLHDRFASADDPSVRTCRPVEEPGD